MKSLEVIWSLFSAVKMNREIACFMASYVLFFTQTTKLSEQSAELLLRSQCVTRRSQDVASSLISILQQVDVV